MVPEKPFIFITVFEKGEKTRHGSEPETLGPEPWQIYSSPAPPRSSSRATGQLEKLIVLTSPGVAIPTTIRKSWKQLTISPTHW